MAKGDTTTQTVESLKEVVRQLERITNQITAAAVEMETSKIEEMQVTNFQSLDLGILNVQGFAGAAAKALYETRRDRGDFGRTQSDTNGREITTSDNKTGTKPDTKGKRESKEN